MIVKGFLSTVLLVNVLLITACSGINTNTPSSVDPNIVASAEEAAWKRREVFLLNQGTWELGSKVSLRYDEENVTFGLNWAQQSSNDYLINISNPLTGALVSKLSRTEEVITLLADNGKTYNDDDEERLLKSQTNLNIPIKGMQFWVRGLTSPDYKLDKLVLDNGGRPLNVEQAGWKIAYLTYVDNQPNALPRKISLSRGAEKIFIRLVAKSWK